MHRPAERGCHIARAIASALLGQGLRLAAAWAGGLRANAKRVRRVIAPALRRGQASSLRHPVTS